MIHSAWRKILMKMMQMRSVIVMNKNLINRLKMSTVKIYSR